ncbi:MAG: phosphate signaling complex protein PhoU [Planctomycetota bacterium]
MPTHLRRELDRLKKLVLELAALVEENLQKAVKAALDRNPDLAAEVIASDVRVDEMEVDVEEECLKILALHQPVAIDLRFIVAVLKLNSDVERIGDLAVNIAERAEYLARHPKIELPSAIPTMFDRTQRMLRDVLRALIDMNTAIARGVREADDEVDDLHRGMYRYVEQKLREDPEEIERLLQILTISRYLERIADHTTNIAEDIIYMIEGEIVRHRTA